MRVTICLLLTPLLAAAAPKPGDEGSPEFDKATALVKQLGNARFPVREGAAKQLIEMGASAVAALQAGTKSEDEEVRTRSAALLPQAKAAAWRRRAEAYLADTEGKQKHDLPLLAEWDKLVDKPDAGSRKLFAAMIRTSGDLLEAGTDSKAAAAAIQDRTRVLMEQVQSTKGQIKADVGELAAVLFVDSLGSVPGAKAGGRRQGRDQRTIPAQLLANPTWVEAVGSADIGPVVRRLLARWIDSRPARENGAMQQFALLASKKPFPEAAPILARAAKSKEADLLSVRLVAVQALSKVGGKEAEAALTDMLKDTTVLFGGGDEHRLGDSALAALVKMKGKNLGDFGLTDNFGIGFAAAPGEEAITLQVYGFRNPDARTKALQKWKDEAGKTDEPKAKSSPDKKDR